MGFSIYLLYGIRRFSNPEFWGLRGLARSSEEYLILPRFKKTKR
jgi:hypothetical protein